jgi:poly-gamma-glutamate synthesis protein (capsule biosynthesis protein)
MSVAALCATVALTLGAPDGFKFAAGGDLIDPMVTESDVASVPSVREIAELFRSADVGFANQEGAIFDALSFKGHAAAENGGGTPLSPARVAKGLKKMGINVVSTANNHATDWGVDGLRATHASLALAGLPQAGTGMSLAEARAPAIFTTVHGTAALVSVASTFPDMSVAGPPKMRDGVTVGARPGISALRVREIRKVTPAGLADLRRVLGPSAWSVPGHPDEVRIGDTLYRGTAESGTTWEMLPDDEAEILASVRQARSRANFVLFAIHAHQTAGDEDAGPAPFQSAMLHFADEAASPDDPRPAEFLPRLFHEVIDAGADAVVRTGPHVLNGIEIYKGKPIFYSLGSLFWPFGSQTTFVTAAGESVTLPPEVLETVIPITTYAKGHAKEIRLHPVTIDTDRGPTFGFPRLAPASQGRKILERVKTLSAPFGTTIRIDGNVGVIEII